MACWNLCGSVYGRLGEGPTRWGSCMGPGMDSWVNPKVYEGGRSLTKLDPSGTREKVDSLGTA